MRRLLVLALLCAATPAVADVPASADTPGKTDAGIAFTQPRDFAVERRGPTTLLSSPEGDLKMAVVDVGAAADARDAAAKAWLIHQPGFSRTVRVAVAEAPKEGWDERVGLLYETSPNEKLYIVAYALRKDASWTVLLFDSLEAAIDKRARRPIWSSGACGRPDTSAKASPERRLTRSTRYA